MRYRAYWAWLALAGLWACSALTASQAKEPVRYRFSAAQIEAIKAAPPGAPVTGWADTTWWISVDGGKPINESHPCPPWPPETCP